MLSLRMWDVCMQIHTGRVCRQHCKFEFKQMWEGGNINRLFVVCKMDSVSTCIYQTNDVQGAEMICKTTAERRFPVQADMNNPCYHYAVTPCALHLLKGNN